MYPLLYTILQLGDPGYTPPIPPGDPGQLAMPLDYEVVSGGTTQTNHSWSEVTNATGYKLQAWNGTAWIDIHTVASGSPSYTYPHTGLTQFTEYPYRLKANGDGVVYTDSEWIYRKEYTDPIFPAIVQQGDYLTDLNGATAGEKTDVLAFLQGLYDDGVDDYLLALYIPCVGNSLSNKLFNYLYPFDDDECFRGVATANLSSVTKGIKSLTANTASLDFKIYPDLVSNAPLLGCAAWVDVAVQQCFYNSDPSFFPIFKANSDGKAYPNIGKSSPGTTFTGSNAAGWQFIQRTDFNTVKGYLNDSLVFTDPVSIDVIDSQETSGTYFPVTFPIKLQCTEANVTFSLIAFWNNPMPDAVRTAFYNRVVTFLTARGVI